MPPETVETVKNEETAKGTKSTSASEVKPELKKQPLAVDERGVPWENRAKEYERKLLESETRLSERESRLLELEKVQAKKVEEVEGFSDADILKEAETLEETKGIPKEQTIATLELQRKIAKKDMEKAINQRISRVESMALGPAYSTAKETVRRENPDFDKYEPIIDKLQSRLSPELRCNPIIIQHNLDALRGQSSNIKSIVEEAVKTALEKAGVKEEILSESEMPEAGKPGTHVGKITAEIRDLAARMNVSVEDAYEIQMKREKNRKEREKK